MKALHGITFILVIVGALNWLLIGINSNWNVVDGIFGTTGVGGTIGRIVYILVGLSAIYLIATHKKTCSKCGGTCDCGKSATPTA